MNLNSYEEVFKILEFLPQEKFVKLSKMNSNNERQLREELRLAKLKSFVLEKKLSKQERTTDEKLENRRIWFKNRLEEDENTYAFVNLNFPPRVFRDMVNGGWPSEAKVMLECINDYAEREQIYFLYHREHEKPLEEWDGINPDIYRMFKIRN